MSKFKASIIIRTKNEEQWIPYCLEAVINQNYSHKEIVIIDDASTDKTLDILKNYPVNLYQYEGDYMPGKSLNFGISKARGDFIVFLSGHCIPKNPYWLENLIKPFKKYNNLAGVYGRQEPFRFTTDSNKRDLWNTFGLDSKLQIKDSFFHNANSCIPSKLLKKYKFDETATNIEDRIWSNDRIKQGYRIFYNSNASVYHWHGINQDNNKKRLSGVVRILEENNLITPSHELKNKKKVPEIAILPCIDPFLFDKDMYLLKKSINDIKQSKHIKKIILLLGSDQKKCSFKDLEVDNIIIRPKHLSSLILGQWPSISHVVKSLQSFKCKSFFVLQENYPYRNSKQIDELIEFYLNSKSRVVMYGQKIRNTIFEKSKKKYKPIGLPFAPKGVEKNLYYSALKGFGMVTDGDMLTNEISIHEDFEMKSLNDQFSMIQINCQKDFVDYYKNNIQKFKVIKLNTKHRILKNVI